LTIYGWENNKFGKEIKIFGKNKFDWDGGKVGLKTRY